MATLVLTAAGSALGGPAGGAIGAFLGRQVERSFRGSSRRQPNDLRVQSSQYGETIPLVFGRMRVAGSVIWAGPLVRNSLAAKSGSRQSYAVSFALSVSSRPIGGIRRIWADGRLIRDGEGRKAVGFQLRVHAGDPDQAADPLIVSALGRQHAPAFRDHAYVVFENLDLSTFGNRIPQITVELMKADGEISPSRIVSEILDIGQSGEDEAVWEGAAAAGDNGREAADAFVRPLGVRFRHDGRSFCLGGSTVSHEISVADLLALERLPDDNGNTGVAAVSMAFFDVDRDYAAGEELAQVPGGGGSLRLVVPAAMTATSAKSAARAALLRAHASRDVIKLTLPLSLLGINVGDLLRSVAGVATDLIVREKIVTPIAVTLLAAPGARALPSIPALPAPSEAVLPNERVRVAIVEDTIGGSSETPDVLVICDGPERSTPAQILAPGITQDVEIRARPGRIGSLLSPLVPNRGHAFDEINKLEVYFEGDPWLVSLADAELHAGVNSLWVDGEIIQFGRAEAKGGGIYVLSRLLRECCDTRNESIHMSGSPVVLLDPRGGERLSLPVQSIGSDIVVRATGLDDVTVEATLSPLLGRSCRPWRPELTRTVHDGGFTAEWTRRSRQGQDWLDFVDIAPPMGGERYLVSLEGGSAVAVQAEVGIPQVSWSAAALTGLGPTPWRLEVREVGGLVASLPLTHHID